MDTVEIHYAIEVDAGRPAAPRGPAQPALSPLLRVDVRTETEARRDSAARLADLRVPLYDYPSWDPGDDRGRDFARLVRNPDFVAAIARACAQRGLTAADPIVLFCPTGRRARRAACRLRQAGFHRPYALSLTAVRALWGTPGGPAILPALFHAT
jgi:rhodanese-related sulfurtransferase